MTTTPEAAEAEIAVPRAYRDHLVVVRDRFLIVSLAALALATWVFNCLPRTWIGTDILSPILAVTSLVTWFFERRKPWHYVISKKEVTIIWAQAKGWIWNWYTLSWAHVAVTGVEQTEWRGLPALRLLGPAKHPERRPDWLIVYAHEDAERVNNQILPMIERYRKQNRQDSLAERLR